MAEGERRADPEQLDRGALHAALVTHRSTLEDIKQGRTAKGTDYAVERAITAYLDALRREGLLGAGHGEPVAWFYRTWEETSWSLTDDPEKIERLRRKCDDRGGRLTNEREPTWEFRPLYEHPGAAGLTPEEAVERVTAIVRQADQAFEAEGGSSRHWVRDHFLPLLERDGLALRSLSGRQGTGT